MEAFKETDPKQPNSEIRQAVWQRMLTRTRAEAQAAMQAGKNIGTIAGLIGLAGILFWCPWCGGWHGHRPPPSPEPDLAPELPQRIKDIAKSRIVKEITSDATSAEGQWQRNAAVDGKPAKMRLDGERIEFLYGGEIDEHGRLEGDGPHHGHFAANDGQNASFAREPGPDRETPVDDKLRYPYGDAERY